MLKPLLIFISVTLLQMVVQAQQTTPDTLSQKCGRVIIAASSSAVFWAGSYLALEKAWYQDYERSSFHIFDDRAEWNQMDKAGHVWTAYQVSRASAELWKWTGMKKNTAAVIGGISGIAYQGVTEIHDGFVTKWGFSVSDVAANVAGAAIFAGQEIAWSSQRIQIKLSYWPKSEPSNTRSRTDELFGTSLAERMLKDYNSQTYWLSMNLNSFFPESNLPPWLNLSVGYGARGLLGGMGNIWTDAEGHTIDRTDIKRERCFYLSPDIDFTKIKTRSQLLRTFFFALNSIKVPAPALRLRGGKLGISALHF